ncbi:MAG: alanine racemase [Spirochaetota bacterium]
MHHTYIELSRGALTHNISKIRKLLPPNTKFAAIVKSNAYGHGMLQIASIAVDAGADVLGVNSLEEALILRQSFPETTILIMGEIPNMEKYATFLEDKNLQIIVSRYEEVAFLAGLGTIRPEIHLKVDTGMGRLGTSGETTLRLIESLRHDGLPLEGIVTHFASTEDNVEYSYSMLQLQKFREVIDYANSLGYRNLNRHCAASASCLLFPEARMDMVRIGISLYGLWPSQETKFSFDYTSYPDFSLLPVLHWKTEIVHLQVVPAKSYIGYGSTYRTSYPTRIAVIPVGYFEGLDRRLSNQGYVLLHGERARIVGRVCMNMAMVDVTHIEGVSLGDEVVLLGDSGEDSIPAEFHAGVTGTINYDVVTRLHPTMTRVITE